MSNSSNIAGVLLTGILFSGCAHTGHRPEEPDAMKARIDSLESQVMSLTQRVETLTADQPATSEDSERPSIGKAKTLTVRQVQRALASAGYYKGTVDGKQGPQTRKAIKAFQQAQGLKADGIVGTATIDALAKYLQE